MAEQNSDRLVWLLTGAAIGATIALLYAPQTGKDTRRLITKKARQGRDAIADVGQDLAEKGRDLYEKGRRVADDAADMLERGRRMMEG
jgi:gas vesicle protein